jgi:hypothetical protein
MNKDGENDNADLCRIHKQSSVQPSEPKPLDSKRTLNPNLTKLSLSNIDSLIHPWSVSHKIENHWNELLCAKGLCPLIRYNLPFKQA